MSQENMRCPMASAALASTTIVEDTIKVILPLRFFLIGTTGTQRLRTSPGIAIASREPTHGESMVCNLWPIERSGKLYPGDLHVVEHARFVRYDQVRTEDETGIGHVHRVTVGCGFSIL